MERVQDLDIFLKKMSKKKLKIKDLNDNDYEIRDIEKFSEHINEFHSSGSSIHEENGYFFLVDDKFRELIKKQKK
tara:strand:- start:207 stop:431 length:225 start_codon:yes stop_codon:yes gene_type:complete